VATNTSFQRTFAPAFDGDDHRIPADLHHRQHVYLPSAVVDALRDHLADREEG